MMTNRQVKILQLLMDNSYSGAELAHLLNASRRTIIRDIATIDYWLEKEKIGNIDTSQKYKLQVNNHYQLETFIQELQLKQYRVLYYLLVYPALSNDDIAAKTLLPKKNIDEIIHYLNQKYKYLFMIRKKVGKGVYLSLTTQDRIDLLASLLFSFTRLQKEIPRASYVSKKFRLKNAKLTQLLKRRSTLESQRQLELQLLSWQLCWTHDSIQYSLIEYFEEKNLRIQKAAQLNLVKILVRINQGYRVKIDEHACAQMLIQHLKRTISFPNYFDETVTEPLKALKASYPFSFELAEELAQGLQDYLKILYIDSQYIGLYIVNAQHLASQSVHAVMYEERHSISNINEMLLKEQVKNLILHVVHSVAELNNCVKKYPITLLLVDKMQLVKVADVNTTYIFNGILDHTDLVKIKNIVDTALIRAEIKNVFNEHDFFNLNNDVNFNFTLQNALKILSTQHLITAKQANAILKREAAGNQLIIGHLSVPHIKATIDEPFRLFYFRLDNAIILNKVKVYGILIVLVNSQASEYTQLFAYLYGQLKHAVPEVLATFRNLNRALLMAP